MKTTIEVSDALFRSAKSLGQQNQTTMRSLIEDSLRRVLADSPNTAKPAFKLKDARVHGKEMLISDFQRWQQLKEEHVISRAIKPCA